MTDYNKRPHEIIDANVNVSKGLILLNVISAFIYLLWWLDFSHAGALWLFIPLLIGEIYHVFHSIAYSATIWNQKKPIKPINEFYPIVDVFITVCGEPTEIVKKTIISAVNMDYPNFKVYVLNDGKGRKAKNWSEINIIAKQYGAIPITRNKNIGAKAGNINNALRKTISPIICIFDADHVPHKDFLNETIPFFVNEKLALVQAPQYYKNRNDSFLTNATWEQQELFFGAICRGKNNMNATFWCGTNAVLRRSALMDVGGVPENNIAEDFLASLFLHSKGWESIYVPKIISEGLAPHDLQNYVKQQFRWARGSSELMFKYNPILNKNLTIKQKLQYLYSSSYYLNGFIVLIDITIPIIVLLTKVSPIKDEFGSFLIFFLPFILSTIYLLMVSTGNTITFKAIQLSMSTFFIYIKAVFSTLFGINTKFSVTSKEIEAGNYLKLAIPHILYAIIGVGVILWAINNQGFSTSVITNSSWIIFNIVMLSGFIRVSYRWNTIPTTISNLISNHMRKNIVNNQEGPIKIVNIVSKSDKNVKNI